MLPLTVSIHNVNRIAVLLKSLDLCLQHDDASKPEEVFNAIYDTLERYEIPWNHCTAFGVDNTNNIIRAKNSIKPRVTQINPSNILLDVLSHYP